VVEHRSSLPAESRIALSLDLLRRPKASSGSTPEEEAGLRGYHEAWGYVFWIPLIVIVFLVPELTAAAGAAICHLPTFSTTVGHLEYVWKLTGLFVVAVMVFTTVNAIGRHRQDRRRRDGESLPPGRYRLDSRGGGRIVWQRAAAEEEVQPLVYIPASITVVLVGGYLANHFADHWTLAYVVWSLIALVVIVVPSVLAFWFARQVPFPTLFRTVANLESHFHLLTTIVIAFLVGLSIHLTLYPWPNVAHVLQADHTITLTVNDAHTSPASVVVTGTTENCTRPVSVTVSLTRTHGPKLIKTAGVDNNGSFTVDFPGKKSDVTGVNAYCGAPKLGSSP
jgi:hypothetical protein